MFAQVPPTQPSETRPTRPKEDIQGAVQSPDFLLYTGILALVLLAAAGVFFVVDRWRRGGRTTGDSSREASLSLSAFREMYENGEITEAEYHRVRDQYANQLRQVPGRPNTPSHPQSPSAAGPNQSVPPSPPETAG